MAYNLNNMLKIVQTGAMTRPQFRDMPTLDLAGAIDNYFNAKDAATQRAQAAEQAQKLGAYSEALQSGDQNAINQAWAAYDPAGYSQYLNQQQQREQDRQWQLEDMARKERAAYGLAAYKNNLQNIAANAERERENAQLDNALASGLITEAEYNQRKRMQILGDIAKNPNTNNTFEKKRIENIAKNMDADIQKSQSILNKYQQAANLLDNIETGGASGQAKEKAWNMFLTPNEQKFRALANEIMPTMRPTGSGSTSDKDMAVFEKATFGLSKDKDANESIIKGRIAAEENNIAHLQFMAEGYDQGVPLSTLDKMWRQYLDNNRIFNDDGSLNKKRKTAEEYFYGGAPLSVQNSQDEQIPVGTIEDGYRFKGGNPSDPNNWEEVR